MNTPPEPSFDHRRPARIGVLVTNLGTPEAPTRGALRPYLRQFLSDPRVVEAPRLLWWLILHGIILNLRPARSARAYQTVWTDEGSPLLVHTRNQARALGERLSAEHGERVVVDYAMRYGQPAIGPAIRGLLDRGADRLLVLPLYPQYSGPTTGSTFDAVSEALSACRWVPALRFIASYHDDAGYIEALAASVEQHRASVGSAELLLFSYHGEPLDYLERGDPYFCHCHKTSRLVAARLGLGDHQYRTCFQSRFGRQEWLKPYTDETLRALPGEGVKSVQVVCPGFSSDCLETLEEIGVENRDYFLEAGGERYEYIPCLNEGEAHIDALASLVRRQAGDWLAAGEEAAPAVAQRYQAFREKGAQA